MYPTLALRISTENSVAFPEKYFVFFTTLLLRKQEKPCKSKKLGISLCNLTEEICIYSRPQ